jgi:hypothetical protein
VAERIERTDKEQLDWIDARSPMIYTARWAGFLISYPYRGNLGDWRSIRGDWQGDHQSTTWEAVDRAMDQEGEGAKEEP